MKGMVLVLILFVGCAALRKPNEDKYGTYCKICVCGICAKGQQFMDPILGTYCAADTSVIPVPPSFGNLCESLPNECGMRSPGTIGCDGSCDALPPTCPAEVNWSGLAPVGVARYPGMPQYPRHVELYKLLKWFAYVEKIEMNAIFRERIIVVGDDRATDGLVRYLREGGLKAYGIEERPTRKKYYTQASFMAWPFLPEIFHLVCAFDFLVRYGDLDFASAQTRNSVWGGVIEETWDALRWGGYLVVGINDHRRFHEMLERKGFLRLPIQMDGMNLYQKLKQNPQKIAPFFKLAVKALKASA